jgi:hypothetical protein
MRLERWLRRALRPWLLAALVASAASACASADATAPGADPCAGGPGTGVRASLTAGLNVWAVLPASTDACITQRLDSHFVYRSADVSPTGRLFVFLPGTDAIAQHYQLILAHAARNGYHAIGLNYPNQASMATLCAGLPSTCYGDARLELLTGQPVSSALSVDRANSVDNRLIKLLRYMRATESAGNWSQFLIGDTAVAWSKVSIAGHSQGGGQALFIAQRHVVYRATAYASYGDGLGTVASVAPWVTRPYATPVTRLFGLISTFDELVSPTTALAVWSAIGMGTALVDVDITAEPYGLSQRFITAFTPANRTLAIGPNHNVVVVDANTPRFGSQVPVFGTVWRALSFPP